LACHGVCSNVEQEILQQKSTLSPINRKRRQNQADSVPIYWTHKPGAIEAEQFCANLGKSGKIAKEIGQ
jgi:hypothetical protein